MPENLSERLRDSQLPHTGKPGVLTLLDCRQKGGDGPYIAHTDKSENIKQNRKEPTVVFCMINN